MRALICRAWGSIDGLTVEEIAPPAPAADEVLIDVRATSVNYADSIMVAGKYQTRPPFPFSPGLETAGVVARCGASATRFKPGDRVMATLAWGGLAEQAVAKESETFPIPARHVLRRGGRLPHRLHLERRGASAGRAGSRRARPCWCWARPAASGSPRWRSARRWARA